MDIDERLRKLESRQRSVLSGSVAAKARFLALDGDPSVTPARVARAKASWRDLEARKAGITAQIDALEKLSRQAIA